MHSTESTPLEDSGRATQANRSFAVAWSYDRTKPITNNEEGSARLPGQAVLRVQMIHQRPQDRAGTFEVEWSANRRFSNVHTTTYWIDTPL